MFSIQKTDIVSHMLNIPHRPTGIKWLVDENEPDMFDCRMREWYIRAASSPKDMIILLDLSGEWHAGAASVLQLMCTVWLVRW